MRPHFSSWNAAVGFSAAALLSALGRTFIDYRFVYAERNLDAGSLAFVVVLNLVIFGLWIWALVDASHGSRRGMFGLLAFAVLVAVFGLYTMAVLCPSPCRTGWPTGEITIWANVLSGALTAVLAGIALISQKRPAPQAEPARPSDTGPAGN